MTNIAAQLGSITPFRKGRRSRTKGQPPHGSPVSPCRCFFALPAGILAAGIYDYLPLALPLHPEIRKHYPRRIESRRLPRVVDAYGAAERALGRKRTVAVLRQGIAAPQGSQGRRLLPRPDARGDRDRRRAEEREELQAAAD